ncbi:MAG: hypothetical protein KKF52_02115 [Nanoarchaeota archaeon]|nr:hypothetical protein [Nanoarchaeota archaeon]MBU4242005.1 hypothetical protein [Nanoarchaeota archaeon]MBU4352572.1 hypothetical protein [Nanoarchaeota archaeon]MCG2719969.1 hypothetical protein [Nanoarchaeota archaeon]
MGLITLIEDYLGIRNEGFGKRIVLIGLISLPLSTWLGGILYTCNKPWKEFEKSQGIVKVVEEKPLTFEEYKNSLKNYKPKFPKISNFKFQKKEIKFYTAPEGNKNGQI